MAEDPGGAALQAYDALDESRGDLAKEAAALLASAEGHIRDDRPDEAESTAREAMGIYRELGERAAVADALRVVIAALQLRDELEDAARMASEELERFEEAEDRNGEAAMLLTLVEMNLDRRGSGEYEDVLSSAMEAQRIYQEEGDKNKVAVVLLALCRLYYDHGKGTSMMQSANGALTLMRAAKDRKGEAQALHAVGLASGLALKFSDSLKHLTAARKLFQELGFSRLEAVELQSIAQCHQSLCDYPQMLATAEESLELFQKLESHRSEVASVGLVVDAHSLLGDHQEALRIAQEALSRYEAAGFARGQASALEYTTSCYIAKRKPQEALESAEAALEILRTLGDARGEATMLNMIAQVQLEAQAPERALKAVEEALGLMRESGDAIGEATARLNTLVNVHIVNQAFNDALQAGEEALGMFQVLGDKKGQGAAKLVAANIYQMMGQFDESVAQAEEARLVFEETSDNQMLARAMQVLIAVNITRQRPDDATSLAYQGHVVSQKAKDKVLEVNMLFLVVQAQFAALKKFSEDGGARPSREFTDMWNKAEKAATAASKLTSGLNSKELAGNAAYVLGEVNLVNGKFKESLRGADEAIGLYKDIGSKALEGTALNLKAQTLKHLGRLEESIGAAQGALALGEEADDSRVQALAKELIDSIQGGPVLRQPVMQQAVEQPEEQQEAVPEASSAVEEEKPKGLDSMIVGDMLSGMLREMMGMEVESDTPFMDAGVDSLMSIEFRSQVNQAFSGLSLSNTLTFDYPTLRELTGHVVEKSLE